MVRGQAALLCVCSLKGCDLACVHCITEASHVCTLEENCFLNKPLCLNPLSCFLPLSVLRGLSGPHDAGHYNSSSWETSFFTSQGGSWSTPYGHFFLSW